MSSGSTMQFTSAQSAAIAAEGNVLVVAGAGTGKTRTLIQRCLRLLQEGASLEHLLLVTFTEAAAAEMKARLRVGLDALIIAHPSQLHLQEQVALLDNAQISTLHSFCLKLIRDHFHELALDPQIVVLDEAQLQPLVDDAMDAALELFLLDGARVAHASNSLLAQFAGEGGAGLRRLIWRLHRYAQTLPDPARWLAEQDSLFQMEQPLRWREWLVQEFVRWVPDWLPRLEPSLDCSNIRLCYETLADLVSPLDSVGLERAVEAIRIADEETPWERGTKTKVRKSLERFFEEAAFFRSLVVVGRGAEDPLQSDWNAVREEMGVILRMVKEFQKNFERSKRELGGVDFADIEQLSLRLLWDETGAPRPTALHCREQFTHVFVDEVQDINAAQDAILRGVSREGTEGNRFLVGDIKQSIYRFRLANPAIFRGYLDAWRHPGGGQQVISLSDNFRSREGILRYVNALFDQMMQSGVGGVVYDEDSHLRFGNPETRFRLKHSDTECRVQLCVLSAESAEEVEAGSSDEMSSEAEELLSSEREARWLADHFKQLHATGHLVWDDSLKEFRGVRWDDMVVLLRSPGAKVESYAKEFHRAGVPISAPRGGFFDSQEILDLLSLLRLLDNPIQDIPLLAVLRSPLGGFSAEDLVSVRLIDKRVPLWTALVRASTPSLSAGLEGLPAACRDKAVQFVAQYTRWRQAIRLGVLSNCLETILSDTHYEALLEAEERGESRLANVRRLLDLTRQYDPYQRQGLFRFLRFVDAQQESDQDLDSAAAVAPNAVRLMSIHKSKGLEFPVVAVADLNKPFNAGDLQQDVLLDEVYGLCPRVVLPETGVRYSSLAHWLARRRGRRELLGEELRLLYVALTRARDLLILVGHGKLKDWEMPTEGESPVSARPLAWEISQARSSLHWIRLWFQRHARPEFWEHQYGGKSPLLSWLIGPAADLKLQDATPETVAPTQKVTVESELAVTDIERRVTWSYPHQAASVEPAKTTVSTLRHRQRELDSEGVPLFRGKLRPSKASTAVVSSTEEGKSLSATERGTLHHLFLQWMDLDHADSLLDLQNEGERLCRSGVFTQEELRSIRFITLAAFWQSELGMRIRKTRDRVQRELPFTARLSTVDLRRLGVIQPDLDLADEEFVVVQGQVDLAVVLDEEIWLLDFKTDAVAVEDVEARAKHYEVQIRIYALALEAIYQRPVTHRWLHFLTVDQTVSLGG